MDKEKLEYFRKKLIDWRTKLIQEATRAIEGGEFQSSEIHRDFIDRAADETDRAFVARIRNREKKLINKINSTIRKIDSGDFGYCEECGSEIGFKRLDARPVASLCIECKKEQEKKEDMRKSARTY